MVEYVIKLDIRRHCFVPIHGLLGGDWFLALGEVGRTAMFNIVLGNR
ncbi:hypothetical protein SAMN05216315_12716 [Nitrosospira sp. Nsp18]|nr:hypothetical protein SAMN05216315_12716 [Nitrosospira sp. Nsp18]